MGDPLLAAICHDLRAPLASVTMGAQYVLHTTPEDEASGRSRRVLEAILRSCKQMERLVRDFADLSEIEGDAVVLRLGIHDAAHILAMAAEPYRKAALTRDVDIAVGLLEHPVLLRCDNERLLRAIGHLLDNAIRLAPQGTTVSLSATSAGNSVRFTVTDHGPGLSDETRANLDDRSWHSRRADRVGAGLGLAIARGLVEAHAGTIEILTTPGTTQFSLVVPDSHVEAV